MARNGQEESSSPNQRPSLPSVRIRSRPDPFLVVCRCFSVVSALTAILCVVVNVMSAVQSFEHGSDVFGGIFRCYAVVIAFFAAIVETEWRFIFKYFGIMEYWAARGMLQIFVAVMTRAFPDVEGEKKSIVFLQEIAAYLLLACGVIYLVSGLLCIGFLKRQRLHQEITREQAVKDLQELEQRREELEALLIAERA